MSDKWAYTDIALADLPPNEELLGADPLYSLTASIRHYGVRVPITVFKVRNALVVADGKRRVKAARAVGLETIPAMIEEGTEERVAGSTIIGNLLRKDNPITEAEAIGELQALGLELTDIAGTFGIPIGTLKRLDRLQRLHPDLLQAVQEGRIAQSVAQNAAKFTQDRQAELAVVYKEQGKLRAKDIRSKRQVHTSEALGELPVELFEEFVMDTCECQCGRVGCFSREDS